MKIGTLFNILFYVLGLACFVMCLIAALIGTTRYAWLGGGMCAFILAYMGWYTYDIVKDKAP